MLKYCEVKMAASVRHSSQVSVALVENGKRKNYRYTIFCKFILAKSFFFNEALNVARQQKKVFYKNNETEGFLLTHSFGLVNVHQTVCNNI